LTHLSIKKRELFVLNFNYLKPY